MKLSRRNLAFAAAALSVASVAFVMFNLFYSLLTACAILVVSICTMSIFFQLEERKFCRERKAAMDAAENLSRSLEFYDRDLPMCRYDRFLFTRALDNAHNIGISLRAWITLVHKHLDRSANAKQGLQLKDVPAFIDNVNAQVREAFMYIREGSIGTAPRILDIFWFDQSTICGDDVRLHPSALNEYSPRPTAEHYEHYRQLGTIFPKLRAVPSPDVPLTLDLNARPLPPSGARFDYEDIDFVEPSATAPRVTSPVVLTLVPKEAYATRTAEVKPTAAEASANPAPRLLLTYDPSEPPPIACTAGRFEELRHGRDRVTRDVVKSEVLPFDTTKRRAKR